MGCGSSQAQVVPADPPPVRVHVVWDIENVFVVGGAGGLAAALQEVTQALQGALGAGRLTMLRWQVALNPPAVPSATRKALGRAGVQVLDICVGRKEMADRLLAEAVQRVLRDTHDFPALRASTAVAVISLDRDFGRVLSQAASAGLAGVFLVTPPCDGGDLPPASLAPLTRHTTHHLQCPALTCKASVYSRGKGGQGGRRGARRGGKGAAAPVSAASPSRSGAGPRPATRQCSACGASLPPGRFSKRQWGLGRKRRCKGCIEAGKLGGG